jgi:hypothetical protein
MAELTFLEASKLTAGTRVRFVRDYDWNYPHVYVKAGATGAVDEQALNEMNPILFIKMDGDDYTEPLKEWEGVLQMQGPEHPYPHQMWNDPAFIEII